MEKVHGKLLAEDNLRADIIREEIGIRADAAFRDSTSATIRQANEIFKKIRTAELAALSTKIIQDSPNGDEWRLYAGMPYGIAEDQFKSTKLWNILREMPKGSLLHAHSTGMVDVDWLVDKVMSFPGMCIQASTALDNEEQRDTGRVWFRYTPIPPKVSLDGSSCIWDQRYVPHRLCSIDLVAEQFPYGSTEGFRRWLRSRCKLSPSDLLAAHRGTSDIWPKFGRCFPMIDSMLGYEPIFRLALRRMFTQLKEENIRYVELRIFIIARFYSTAGEALEPNFLQVVRTFEEESDSFKGSSNVPFYGGRLIWTIQRRLEQSRLRQSMEDCIVAKKAHPRTIVGFDLAGREDITTLTDLKPMLLWFKMRCVEESVDIPFFLHAGEAMGYGDTIDGNILDAVLLGSLRIGHALSLSRHPVLVKLVKEKNITIECCLLSNQALRFVTSIGAHPLPAMFAQGLPLVLSSDDPFIFGRSDLGMTAEFWHVCTAFQGFDLIALASMVENSVRWTHLDGNSSNTLRDPLEQWRSDFSDFCKSVIELSVE